MVTLAASALRGAGGFVVVLALIIARRTLRARGGITSSPQHVVKVSLAYTNELAHKLLGLT